jgi:hypothetical protein
MPPLKKQVIINTLYFGDTSAKNFPRVDRYYSISKRKRHVYSKGVRKKSGGKVERFRKGLLDEEVKTLSRPNSLKKDNISPSKVVEIIDEKRKMDKEKRTYQKLTWPLLLMMMKGKIYKCLSLKIEELKSIFVENNSSMEWTKIVEEVTKEEQTACNVSNLAPVDSLIFYFYFY